MKSTTIELWVIVDAGGDFGFGRSGEEAAEHYEENIGGFPGASRLVKVTLNVPLPVVTELTGDVPADMGGKVKLEVA